MKTDSKIKPADTVQDFPCDLCGSDDCAEIEVARHYMGEGRLHVCKGCGFVYVRRRRSARAIADSWSDELYQTSYTARIPAIVARQTYVAEFIHSEIGLKDKSLCDVGAGEGLFLDMIREDRFGAAVFGIEPSSANGELMTNLGIGNFVGTIEDYAASGSDRKFDIATIMWTLENCQSCLGMLRSTADLLRLGGHVAISTGSRILVPYKKPLHYYLGPTDADTHAFRFSVNALTRALALSGFEIVACNRYVDSDCLAVIGRKTSSPRQDLPIDDWSAVADFFRRWHEDTRMYYSQT